MNKEYKKAFTLVELLAVIVILAVILVIAVPQILGVIENSKKAAVKSSGLLLLKKIEDENQIKEINGIPIEKEYIFTDGVITPSLEITGELPKSGTIVIDDNNKINMSICYENYCLIKSSDTEEITICDMRTESCQVPPKVTKCYFDGELKVGTVYKNGSFSYRYKQKAVSGKYVLIEGWSANISVALTSPKIESPCTYINDYPVVSYYDMFYSNSLTELDLSTWNTSQVTDMKNMFYNSRAEKINLSSFDTSKVTDMSSMFLSTRFTELDISNFDTSNVTNMESMFSLTKIKKLDISDFNTGNVTNMKRMFASSAAESLDISNLDTSKVTDMFEMFSNSKTHSIKIGNINTSKVENMSGMFSQTLFIESIDLSGLDTENVTNMLNMFIGTAATTGYAKTVADANRFNSSSNKPASLNFIVKP